MLAEGMIISSLLATKRNYERSGGIHVPAGHVHTLTFRTDGSKTILPEGSRKPLISAPNSITYMPRGVAYDVSSHECGSMYAVHFELAEECEVKPFVFCPKSPIEYENLFSNICARFRVGNDRDYRCLSMMYELLAAIRHETGEADRRAVPKRIRDAVDDINKNYNDPELCVSSLAKKAGVSEVYFRREFKACTGLPPVKYIKKIRLENAKALLSTALYSVGEVATRCGFDSISYFSEEFRKAYGEPPSKLGSKPFWYEMF